MTQLTKLEIITNDKFILL